MFYAIRHFTSYRYSRSVWQSMMEVRMHPRSEGNQRCFVFQLSVNPRARIFGYTDSYGNLVHHFDLPPRHGQLTIISDALVDIDVQPSIPEIMEYQQWQELEDLIEKKDYWEMLMPSHFARSSPELEQLAGEIGATERKGRDVYKRQGQRLPQDVSLRSAWRQSICNFDQWQPLDQPIGDHLAGRRF